MLCPCKRSCGKPCPAWEQVTRGDWVFLLAISEIQNYLVGMLRAILQGTGSCFGCGVEATHLHLVTACWALLPGTASLPRRPALASRDRSGADALTSFAHLAAPRWAYTQHTHSHRGGGDPNGGSPLPKHTHVLLLIQRGKKKSCGSSCSLSAAVRCSVCFLAISCNRSSSLCIWPGFLLLDRCF